MKMCLVQFRNSGNIYVAEKLPNAELRLVAQFVIKNPNGCISSFPFLFNPKEYPSSAFSILAESEVEP